MEWSNEDKQLLLQQILQINGIDGKKSYKTFENSINWEALEVNGRTPEENKMMFHQLITKVRKYRTMKEIVTDAAQLITAGPSKTSKTAKQNFIKEQYPDFPTTKVQNAYALFVKKRFKKVQGMKFKERSALLSMEWKNLPESRKEKYRRKSLKLKEKLAEELKVFSLNHPEALLPSNSGNNTGRPTLPLPSRLYAESRVEKFKAKHPELNHGEAFKACLKKYEKLSDRRKLKWIIKGKDQMQEYEKDVESYMSSHQGSFKPQQFHLTKDEQRIFDESMGKPPAPARNIYQYFCESKRSTVADKDFSEKNKALSSLYHKLTEVELDNLETALRQEVQNYAEKYVEYYDSLSENDKQIQLNPIEAMRPYAKILTGAKLNRKSATLGSKDVTVYKQLQLSSLFPTSKKTKKTSDESDDEIPPSQASNGSIKKRKVQVEQMSNSETHEVGSPAKKKRVQASPLKEENEKSPEKQENDEINDSLLAACVPKKSPKKQEKVVNSQLGAGVPRKTPKKEKNMDDDLLTLGLSKKTPKKDKANIKNYLHTSVSGSSSQVDTKSPKLKKASGLNETL